MRTKALSVGTKVNKHSENTICIGQGAVCGCQCIMMVGRCWVMVRLEGEDLRSIVAEHRSFG